MNKYANKCMNIQMNVEYTNECRIYKWMGEYAFPCEYVYNILYVYLNNLIAYYQV